MMDEKEEEGGSIFIMLILARLSFIDYFNAKHFAKPLEHMSLVNLLLYLPICSLEGTH